MWGFVWVCVLAILSVGPRFQCPAPGWCAGLGVRVRPRALPNRCLTQNVVSGDAISDQFSVSKRLTPSFLVRSSEPSHFYEPRLYGTFAVTNFGQTVEMRFHY